jgi:triosephosphate isomerase
MHGPPSEARKLVQQILEALPDLSESSPEVAVAPAACALAAAREAIGDRPLALAAQNVHPDPSGAFTGEISVPMLADLGVRYVIVGHSERRSLFGDSDALVRAKVDAVLAGGLSAILCVGESLRERDGGFTLNVVRRQLAAGLGGIGPSGAELERVVVAYEPVWAIGTGRTATPEQAQEVHADIRAQLAERWGDRGRAVRLQYGGSVKPGNAADLFAQPDVDGGLVGGASLKASDFAQIVAAASPGPA